MATMLSDVSRNVRGGVRGLLRAPGFAAVAVLTLALGIGLSTTVFTVANTMLLRKLPVADQEHIVVVSGRTPDGKTDNYPLSLDGAREFGDASHAFSETALVTYEGAVAKPIRDGDRISRLKRALVSGNYFKMLGVVPVLGRTLEPGDDASGAAPVMVISNRVWRERFGATASVIGRRVVMHDDGTAYTIVGVIPSGVDYPRRSEAWVAIHAATAARNLPLVAVNVIGRLVPGAPQSTARDEMTAFFTRAAAPQWQHGFRGSVRSLPELITGDTKPALLVFAAAALLLLLMACANVATLLLVRGVGRQREFAVRAALGANRLRVVQQLITENSVLAALGGVLGIAVALTTTRLFVSYAPAGLPRIDEIHIGFVPVLAAIAITTFAMTAFAVIPAFMTSNVKAQAALRGGVRLSGHRKARALAEALVSGQIALALLVLCAAALVGQSLLRLERAKLSIDSSSLTIAELSLPSDSYDNSAKQLIMLNELSTAIRAIPGVSHVSPVVAAPFSGSGGWDGAPTAEGQSLEQAKLNPQLNLEVVSSDYFATVGLTIVSGRGFSDADRDGAPNVVVLSETAARQYWPNATAIGQRVSMGSATNKRVFTVVGVVPDTRYRDLREARASIYFPMQQPYFPFAPATLIIRASGARAATVAALRKTIAAVAPGVALVSANAFESYLDTPLAQPRLNALLLLVFAASAVLLASIGLFGAMSTMVSQRTREFGIRMALGATASGVAQLVVRRSLRLASIGLLVGVAGALAANRLLASLLYDIAPNDFVTLLVVTVALLIVAVASGVVPARVGARIEPMVALSAE